MENGLTGLVVLLCSSLISVQSISLNRREVFTNIADASKGYPEVQWGLNATHIEVQLVYPTTGWIAMGLSPNGAMDQSDVLFGYVDDRTGKPVIQDRFLNASKVYNAQLSLDQQQDWIPISGSQNATHTTIRAVRKLQTCDLLDRPITDAKVPVLFSFNVRDPPSPTGVIPMHTQRGSASINFFGSSAQSQFPSPRNTMTMNFTMQNTVVHPGVITQYTCKFFKVPSVTRKLHIIADKPIIDPANKKIIHHVVMYLCPSPPSNIINGQFDCGINSNDSMPKCEGAKFLTAWAAGGQGTTYPPEAGYPLNPSSKDQYVWIQLHYNNVDMKERLDNSGMSFIMTDKLRPNDIGTFGVGASNLDFSFTIPPHQKEFKVVTQCSDQCTSKLPAGGITIVSGLLHMHQRGKKIVARHIRGDEELPPLLQDMQYNYNFQTVNDVVPPRQFLPGDRIQFECTYTTEDDNTVITGGEDTSKEMCLAAFNYYPDTGFVDCAHSYSVYDYLHQLRIPPARLEQEWKKSPSSNGLTLKQAYSNFTTAPRATEQLTPLVESYLQSHKWTDAEVKSLQQFYAGSHYIDICIWKNWNISVVTDDKPPELYPYIDTSITKGCRMDAH